MQVHISSCQQTLRILETCVIIGPSEKRRRAQTSLTRVHGETLAVKNVWRCPSSVRSRFEVLKRDHFHVSMWYHKAIAQGIVD